jgi:hypothetical protein
MNDRDRILFSVRMREPLHTSYFAAFVKYFYWTGALGRVFKPFDPPHAPLAPNPQRGPESSPEGAPCPPFLRGENPLKVPLKKGDARGIFSATHRKIRVCKHAVVPLDSGGNVRKNFYCWGSQSSICSKHL